jgi:nitrate/nitrite-specific signal transduction histidine kinase
MNKIAGGDFNMYIPIESTDEIGELAGDFGVMKDAVVARNANLEKLVRLRNMELEHSNEHIELMHKELESVNSNIKKLESKNRKLYDEASDIYRTENTER